MGRAGEHGVHPGTCEILCLTVHSFLCHFCRPCREICTGVYSLVGEGNPVLRPSRGGGWRWVQTGGSEAALEQEGLEVAAVAVPGFRACRSQQEAVPLVWSSPGCEQHCLWPEAVLLHRPVTHNCKSATTKGSTANTAPVPLLPSPCPP